MKGPLSSLKVLDFSTLLPGPFASLLLADIGADMLRVESPGRMDLVRVLPPHVNGTPASHAYPNHNKRSIDLNLKRQGACEVMLELIRRYDIVLEQFRPGVMDKLGVGYEALKAANSQLIYVAATGYGQIGPYRERVGHDIDHLALAGVVSYTGRRERGPLPLGVQLADLADGSLHGVMGPPVAVIHRQQTDEGQFVDISMTDCALSPNGMAGAGYLVTGVEPEMKALALNDGSFYDYYRTRDGRWFPVGNLEPQFMQQFYAAIGRPELAARGLSPKPEEQRAPKCEIEIEFEKCDFAKWQATFAALDACVESLLSLSEALEHPQLQARGLVTRVSLADGGNQAQMACPIKFSTGLPTPRHIGATLGADTVAVLEGLSYSAERIAELKTAEAIA